jgi:23S rRNA (adenine2030-N6)-methyltransferase
MNYRHAFHAGNFADCVKHALLVWCVRALQRKDSGVLLLDTHAGIGLYDLAGGEAARTGEWLSGIARLRDAPPAALADYLALATADGPHVYPGSPELLLRLARPQDRVVLCELHPDDAVALRARYRGRAAVHARDGYEAAGALLPPRGLARALVLVDPPYESPDEFDRAAAALATIALRMAGAVVLVWYPIKGRAASRAFLDGLRDGGLRDLVAAEFLLRAPEDFARLNGCGLLLRNPPFGFEGAAPAILDALHGRLADGAAGAGVAVRRIADE